MTDPLRQPLDYAPPATESLPPLPPRLWWTRFVVLSIFIALAGFGIVVVASFTLRDDSMTDPQRQSLPLDYEPPPPPRDFTWLAFGVTALVVLLASIYCVLYVLLTT